MSTKKVKETAKIYISDQKKIRSIVVNTMDKISNIVGATLGPSGRICLIESEHYGIPNKNTKDGVTVFKSLGAADPFEQLIIEQTREVAVRTANEAGDGTTSGTILATALIKNLLNYCDGNKKTSPQKVVRIIKKFLDQTAIPFVQGQAIKVDIDNRQDLLFNVAKISANGDEEMARAVMEAFELTGMSENSHVTIKEVSGPGGYSVDLIEGFPIAMGLEDSVSKWANGFINDQAGQRCVLENPLFILFDGQITDLMTVEGILGKIHKQYESGDADFKNVVIVCHGFSEGVITSLGINFANPTTINVLPLVTPMTIIKNSRFDFLHDLSAFTGAKVFSVTEPLHTAEPHDLGTGMEKIEVYRFRSTVVGNPDQLNIEARSEVIKTQMENPESMAAKMLLQERLGKLTSGIAKIEVMGGSAGELKEAVDRVEDATMAVRASIKDGVLPGGCRTLVNLAMIAHTIEPESKLEESVYKQVIAPSLLTPINKLLDNAGYNEEEIQKIISRMFEDTELVYDIENQEFGTGLSLGVLDAEKAVEQALRNSVSIASVMGTMGGLVAFPRDHQLERAEALQEMDFLNNMNSGAGSEADERA